MFLFEKYALTKLEKQSYLENCDIGNIRTSLRIEFIDTFRIEIILVCGVHALGFAMQILKRGPHFVDFFPWLALVREVRVFREAHSVMNFRGTFYGKFYPMANISQCIMFHFSGRLHSVMHMTNYLPSFLYTCVCGKVFYFNKAKQN